MTLPCSCMSVLTWTHCLLRQNDHKHVWSNTFPAGCSCLDDSNLQKGSTNLPLSAVHYIKQCVPSKWFGHLGVGFDPGILEPGCPGTDRSCLSNRTTTTKTCKVNYLWRGFKFKNTADIGQKDFTAFPFKWPVLHHFKLFKAGSHYENKWQGFKITGPNLGRANVITGHYGQTNLNAGCYGQPYWVCKKVSEGAEVHILLQGWKEVL